jgi:CRISPR-associated endonuclease Csn1
LGIRYAFDLGTNSIGLAVWRTGPDPAGIFGQHAPLELLWSGVRLFKDGRNPKDQQSLAVMRRVPRQSRRRRDRFLLRRADLMAALVAAGLMPATADERKRLESIDPYALRAAALDRPLAAHEVGRAIFHLNQRRGFKSNRKTDKADKDKGKIATASARLADALREQNCRTLGEFLWMRHRGEHHDPRRVRDGGRQSTRIRIEGAGAKALYEFYPTRAMVRDEFDAIWRAQARHAPTLLTDERRDAIAKILFRQRDLKPPKIGKCTFEPSEERLPKALPSVEARELYERLAHIRISEGSVDDRPLLPEQRDALASVLLAGGNLSFAKVRKALKLGGNARINFEESGEKEIKGCLTGRLLSKDNHYGRRWLGLSWARKDAFVGKLLAEADEATLVARLMREDGLSEEAAGECASIPLADGYSRLGPTANAAILQALITERDAKGFVVTYAEAVVRAAARLGRPWHHSDERDGEIFARLPYYGQVLQRHILPGSMDEKDKGDDAAYWGRLMNPTVHIGLNQLRRVVNALIVRFGAPDQVVVELARELKLNTEQKEKEQKRNRDNRAANDKRAVKLGELGEPDNGETRARLKLFEEQQAAGDGVALCPFSGRPIGIAQLFSSEIEIEHILPRSRTLDDSPANKVLCYRTMNRIKRGKSPFEAFGHTPQWDDVAARAEKLPMNKRWRFKPDAMEKFERDGDFLQRQLNETKYLSRLAKAYLGKICDPDQVYVTPGALTGLLRGKWGLNSLISDDNRKNRDDHRHHAIDAIVIGAMTRGLLQSLAREAGRAEATEYDAVLGKIAPPFEGFRDAVRASIETLIVSNKPEHGKSGALHEATAYGLIAEPAEARQIGNLVRRKPVVDLTAGEIDAVRDPVLRRRLQAIAAPSRDAKGKVMDDKAFKAALGGFAATPLPDGKTIRRVRVGKEEDGVVRIADRRTGAPYKAVSPGENHHIDIVQMRDGSWKGFAATVFEVNRKEWRPVWERDRLGGKLVMRLHKGDAVEVDDNGKRIVKAVVRIEPSAGRVRLAPHNEGGDLQKRHDDPEDPFRWDLATISKLRERGCVALKVNQIGLSQRKRTNVSPQLARAD